MRKVFATIVPMLMVAGLVAPPAAHGVVTGTTGSVVKIARPASVRDGALRSNTLIRTFDEMQDVRLTSGLYVNFTASGTYDRQSDLRLSLIPVGTYVRSHLLHADRASDCGTFCYASGTASFDRDVIGVITQGTHLSASDGRLGWTGTAYSTGLSHRGMEFRDFDPPNDEWVTLSSGRQTVTVRMAFANVMDEIRVVSGGFNLAPTARNDYYATDEDTPLFVAAPGLLGNDTEPNPGDFLSASVVSPPSNGTLALAANGSFTYTPGAEFNGTDFFTYRATDAGGLSSVAIATIQVGSVCDAPVAAGDSMVVEEDASVTIEAPGVLANDTDADGDSLEALMDTEPEHGTLELAADGSLVYTPEHNWDQADSFTYLALDSCGLASEPATVEIELIPLPEPTSLIANPAVARLVTSPDAPDVLTVFFPDLSATLTEEETGIPIGGRAVEFYAGEKLVCVDEATDDLGVARCGGVVEEIRALANLGFEARYAGEADYEPSSDIGVLVEIEDSYL